MKAGFKSIDITPPVGIPIGGNVRDDSISRGVHDSLRADIIVLNDGKRMIALVDLDWVAAEIDTMRSMKNEIVKISGIEYENICISTTHTHSGPDVYAVVKKTGMADSTREYIKNIIPMVANGVKSASVSQEEVLIGIGKGYEDGINFNRRIIMKDGSLHMNWEFKENPKLRIEDVEKTEGPVDPEINVIKITDKGKNLKAVIVNFALHPAVLVGQDFLFGKDYIWGLEEELKGICKENVMVYFANGTQGNINHINIYDKDQKRGWYEAERIGRILGRDVKEIMDRTDVYPEEEISVLYRIIRIPIRDITQEEYGKAKNLWEECKGEIPSLFDGVPDEWYAGDICRMVAEDRKDEEVELQVIKIGNTVIATLPGEVFAEYGLKLKQQAPFENTLLFGITNHSAGYIPTPDAIKNGGMEGRTCHFSKFALEAGDMIAGELLDMIGMLDN